MTRNNEVLLAIAAILLAFAIGFGWQYVRADRLADRLETTEREVAFLELESTLAAATLEVQRGNFEAARRLASLFFTGLQEHMGDAPAHARGDLARILAQRDEAITFLSRGDPEARDLLDRMYVEFRVAVRGADQALPVGDGDGSALPVP